MGRGRGKERERKRERERERERKREEREREREKKKLQKKTCGKSEQKSWTSRAKLTFLVSNRLTVMHLPHILRDIVVVVTILNDCKITFKT